MKIRHKIDDYNYINIIGIGSIDKLTVNEPDEFDFEESIYNRTNSCYKTKFKNFWNILKRTFKNKSGYLTASLSNNRLENNFKRFKNNVEELDPVYSNISVEDETKLRLISTHNLNDYKISYGANLQSSKYSNNTLFRYYNMITTQKLIFLNMVYFLSLQRIFLKID